MNDIFLVVSSHDVPSLAFSKIMYNDKLNKGDAGSLFSNSFENYRRKNTLAYMN